MAETGTAIVIEREYICVEGDIGSEWGSPPTYRVTVWEALLSASGDWDVKATPDVIRPGYTRGQLFTFIDGEPSHIAEAEELTGLSRDDILASTRGDLPSPPRDAE